MLVLKFFVVLFALLSSLLWLSNFVADITNPKISFSDGQINGSPRTSRLWLGLIASILWAVFITFF